MLFGLDVTSEDQQPAGISIEPMNRSGKCATTFRWEVRWIASEADFASNQSQHDFVEARLRTTTSRWPVDFCNVPPRHHARRLVHDDDRIVNVNEPYVFVVWRWRQRLIRNCNNV